jgi:hypothetical protein
MVGATSNRREQNNQLYAAHAPDPNRGQAIGRIQTPTVDELAMPVF